MSEHPISTTPGRRELARQTIYEHGNCVVDLDDGVGYVLTTYEGMVKAGIFDNVELDDEDLEAVLDLIEHATITFTKTEKNPDA